MDARERETIQNRIKKLKQDIIQIKASQYASGDSWILHAVSGSFTGTPNKAVQVDFIPDSPGLFTWNIYSLIGEFASLEEFFPDYANPGRAYYTANPYSTTTVDFVVYATKRGTVKVTYL